LTAAQRAVAPEGRRDHAKEKSLCETCKWGRKKKFRLKGEIILITPVGSLKQETHTRAKQMEVCARKTALRLSNTHQRWQSEERVAAMVPYQEKSLVPDHKPRKSLLEEILLCYTLSPPFPIQQH
jgi:hypothetical protein